jgi:hypothetical protein
MAIPVPTAAEAAKKWAEVTPGRQGYYEAGAKGAGSTWEANAIAASKAFKAGISAGNIEQMFAGGIKRAGAAKYQRKITDVGASRFSSGVAASVQDMQAGVEPFLATIASITLPQRAPRGSTQNLQRVALVADALNKKRLALRTAGG